MTSDEAVEPIDIQQLLDLLNASDRDEPRSVFRKPDQAAGDELHRMSTKRSDAVEVSAGNAEEVPTGVAFPASETAVPDDAENRFAAHIVHGMSKLKGG